MACLILHAMESTVLFEEVQQFGKKGFQLFLKFAIAVLIVCSFSDIIFSKKSETVSSLIAVTVIVILLGFLLNQAKLITEIRTDGIYVRFPPFQSSYTICLFEDISELYIRQYRPLLEFGGWGIRFGLKGRAYNVSGNIGIQIVFKNGSKLLIGTNEGENIARVLSRMGKLTSL
jgi:hypothetical protein